jgi:hypothetical protein
MLRFIPRKQHVQVGDGGYFGSNISTITRTSSTKLRISKNKNADPTTPTAMAHGVMLHMATHAMLAIKGNTPLTIAIQSPCLTMNWSIQ